MLMGRRMADKLRRALGVKGRRKGKDEPGVQGGPGKCKTHRSYQVLKKEFMNEQRSGSSRKNPCSRSKRKERSRWRLIEELGIMF